MGISKIEKARRRKGGKKKTESRGTQFGNTRGRERQRRRADLRQSDPRYQAAMADRDEAQAKLDEVHGGHAPIGQYAGMTRRIMAELLGPVTSVNGVTLVAPPTPKPKTLTAAPLPALRWPDIDPKAEGTGAWELRHARAMLRQGYRIDHVIAVTGWGPDWFDDLPLDEDGFGLDPYADL